MFIELCLAGVSPSEGPKKTLLHRDIKLDNMLFVPPEGMTNEEAFTAGKGEVKILDFGFARLIEKTDRYSTCGSPEYVAPEIMRGEPYNQKIDVYSAAATILIMATLATSIYHNLPDLLDAMRDGVDIIEQHLGCFPNVDRQLADFIRAVGHKDPEQRLTVEQALGHPFLNPVEEAAAGSSSLVSKRVVAPMDLERGRVQEGFMMLDDGQ